MSSNGVVGLKIMLHPNTSESFEETILKTIKANQFLHLKVVIPTTWYRHKKMVFSTPQDEYCVSDHDIGDERTSDGYL